MRALTLAAAAALIACDPSLKTVDQAIEEASREPPELQAGPFSCVRYTYPDAEGKEVSTPWRHNLTTTTASGYTNAFDWLAKLMGQGPSAVGSWALQSGAGFTVNATSVSSLVGLPTSGQGLNGWLVVVFGSTNNSLVYGVAVSNSSTAVTVDQWYSPTSTSGAAGTTPTGGTFFVMFIPQQSSASWMAVTSNSFSPATSDTTLAGELTSNGFARAVGSWGHTAAASTYTLVHLWTATGTQTINNEAQFGAANPTAGGVMPFESAETSPPTLVSGDTLQNTVTFTI